MTNRCKKCRWFDHNGAHCMPKDEGLCRANAPAPRSHDDLASFSGEDGRSQQDDLMGRNAYWPVVSIDDWCGQFVVGDAP